MGSSKRPEKFFNPINVISRPEVSSISLKALTIPFIMGYPIKSNRMSIVGATNMYPRVLECRLFFRIYPFLRYGVGLSKGHPGFPGVRS